MICRIFISRYARVMATHFSLPRFKVLPVSLVGCLFVSNLPPILAGSKLIICADFVPNPVRFIPCGPYSPHERPDKSNLISVTARRLTGTVVVRAHTGQWKMTTIHACSSARGMYMRLQLVEWTRSANVAEFSGPVRPSDTSRYKTKSPIRTLCSRIRLDMSVLKGVQVLSSKHG